MSYGRTHRMKRLFNRGRRILIMAMDHGIPYGDVYGEKKLEDHLKDAAGKVDAIILNKGVIDTVSEDLLNRFEIIFKLNGITAYSDDPYDLVMLSDVEEAVSYDPAAVSYELYLGGRHEHDRLGELGKVIRECSRFDIPLISHIYPNEEKKDPEIISHCMRLGLEMGTDIIKTFYYKGMEKQISRTARPVVIAGGPKMKNSSEVVNYARNAMKAGAAGIAMGRNLWGWGDDTVSVVTQIARIVHEQAR
jgi:2-amino-4,5-dihydroxy-6-oxo-7-(phosphonooxy)heptanoate synthase